MSDLQTVLNQSFDRYGIVDSAFKSLLAQEYGSRQLSLLLAESATKSAHISGGQAVTYSGSLVTSNGISVHTGALAQSYVLAENAQGVQA